VLPGPSTFGYVHASSQPGRAGAQPIRVLVPRWLADTLLDTLADSEPNGLTIDRPSGEPGADPSARLSGHAIIFGRLVDAPGRAWLTGPSGDRDHH
jgi:hypothetical protein